MDTEWTDSYTTQYPWPPAWEPITPAQSHLYTWVRSTDRRFAKSFARLLRESKIIASEWAALRELYRPQCWSPVELGKAIGMSKGGASKLVTRLVAKGLAFKETPEFDRRFRSVGLTRQGRDLVTFMAPIEKAADREFFKPLGNNRRFWMNRWMKRVLRADRRQHMEQWVSTRLQESTFIQADAEAHARAMARAQAEADELWEYCKQVARAAAYGLPYDEPPPIRCLQSDGA